MTELRKKMIRAMELKNLSHNTQRAYLAAVTGIAKFYNLSPDKMTQEKIEDYLLYLKLDKENAPNSCYSVLCGLRFFYKHVTEKEIPQSDPWCHLLHTRSKYYTHIVQSCQIVAKRHRTSLFYQ